jgi:hypothetical protein
LTGAYAETIPNFEVLTLVVFCAGVLLGVRDGILTGVVTMLVYSLLNPYGAAPPLITIVQVLGEAAAGAAGGVLAAAGIATLRPAPRAAALAASAVLLTLFFDFVTNFATGLVMGQVRVALIGGIPFSLWHIGWNIALFVGVGTPLIGALSRYRSRLSY